MIKKSEKLIINMPNAKFGFQPNNILYIENCQVGLGTPPEALPKQIHIVGNVKQNNKNVKIKGINSDG